MANSFEKNTFGKRFGSMLKVDFKRLFLSRAFYIILAACLLAPVLILVMVTMMDGTVSVDPQTGKETVMEGFDHVWQIIGTVSDPNANAAMGGDAASGAASMDMSITSMCNINMLYFAIAALVCIFVADDFRSGYQKNLFTVRAKKTDYVASKTVVLTFGAAMMILAFFVGSLVGGAVAGLPYTMEGFNTLNLLMCILAKMVLVSVFVPIYLVMSVVAKQKLWLSILLSMMVGMFLFMMIPMLTPLNATLIHVLLCAVGGVGFGFGLGAIGNLVLKKTSLV
ncbi:MAG: ABC transporter permease [Clostridia bacterium]|nr:ABC transporter permease [Clostridia bacterium]